MAKKWVTLVCIVALVAGLMIGHFAWGVEAAQTLTIYHAGSLAVPFKDLAEVFESTHPNVDVLCESGGSAAIINKSITLERAGERPPDIIASADYTLIPDRLYEEGYADWDIVFARNKMVLCYRDDAPHAAEIEHRWEPPYDKEITGGDRIWYDVLRSEEVSYGHSNPDDDPCGYRTLMVIQLAELYYEEMRLYDALIPGSEHERGRVTQGRERVRSKSVDLIALLKSGDLDYAFEYRSVAVQHGLNFIELDDAINLSQTGKIGNTDMLYEDFYEKASIEIIKDPGPPPTYKTKKGKPIVYGITIPQNAPNKGLAMEFIALLLSQEGQNIMYAKNGQPCIVPALCDRPEKLRLPIEEGTP